MSPVQQKSTPAGIFSCNFYLAATSQRFSESRPKLAVEIGVNQGVEGGVEITHPEDQRDHFGGVRAVVAKGGYDVPETKFVYVTPRVILLLELCFRISREIRYADSLDCNLSQPDCCNGRD